MFEKISECYSDKGFVYCNAWNENQQINDICNCYSQNGIACYLKYYVGNNEN